MSTRKLLKTLAKAFRSPTGQPRIHGKPVHASGRHQALAHAIAPLPTAPRTDDRIWNVGVPPVATADEPEAPTE